MARQKSHGKSSAPIPDPIALQAKKLADQYGVAIVDAKVCLTRLVDAFAKDLLGSPRLLHWALRNPHQRSWPLTNAGIVLDDSFSFHSLGLFEDALQSLPRRQAVQLLRDEDLPQLVRRMRALEELTSDKAPFFTLAELADHAREFAKFLELHRVYLVKTGLPPRYFRPCVWLHIHLGRLYDTRRTGSPYSFDELNRPGPEVDVEPPYRWYKTPGDIYLASEKKYCAYEEADILKGMMQTDVDRIECDRGRFFDLKLRIVKRLGRLTLQSDLGGLWQTCLSALNDTFNPTEIAFWLRMDRLYFGSDPRLGNNETCSRKMAPGGLTNLFEVIGRYEAEAGIRTFTDASRALKDVATKLREGGSDRELVAPDFRYFEVLHHDDRRAIDVALDEFEERFQAENEFWEDYRDRVQLALGREVRIRIPIEMPSHRHVRELRSTLQTDATALVRKFDNGELFGELSPNRRIFRKDGNSWTICFDGKLISKPDSVGLSHIAQLLGNPGKRIYAKDLRAAQLESSIHPTSLLRRTSDGKIDPSSVREKEEVVPVTARKKEDDNNGGGGDHVALMGPNAGDVLDREAEVQYRATLRKLEKDLAEAEAAGDVEKVDKNRQDIAWISRELKKAFSRGGAPRKMQSEEKKANDAVRVAINRALNDLEKAHPALWRHLQPPNLTVGPFFFLYAPDPPIDWEL